MKCKDRPPAPALLTDVLLLDVEKKPGGFEIQRPKIWLLNMLDASKSLECWDFPILKRSEPWGYHLETSDILIHFTKKKLVLPTFWKGENQGRFRCPSYFTTLGNAWNSRGCSLQVSLYCLVHVDAYHLPPLSFSNVSDGALTWRAP